MDGLFYINKRVWGVGTTIMILSIVVSDHTVVLDFDVGNNFGI